MSRIQVLPPNIANKIAAGEVVDRPAAVVKELVENSIDAEANQVTIVISQAGKELIQVIDNGIGMSEEDALLAFERHATSKIRNLEDLDQILTLGFRGEALPSIASVSRLEIKTCSKGEQVGTILKVDGGKLLTREKRAAKQGTTISVKNLFYNTPARRNFLRADSTEFNQILKWVKRFFLACPDIHFTLIHNGEELYNLPAAEQEERITQVFGQKFLKGLAPVSQTLNGILLEGWVCRPDRTRSRADNQFIYLNGRSIINRSLSHAIFQGYGNLIDRSQYPQYVLYLDIPADMVDINVHPAKLEVRFANERAIYQLFLNAVREAIQTGSMVPDLSIKPASADRQAVQLDFDKFRPAPALTLSQAGPRATIEPEPKQMTFEYDTKPRPSGEKSTAAHTEGKAANLWQLHNRYILSEIKSGMVIIDQHLAHQRIIFEQVLESIAASDNLPSQQLLFPQTVELTLEDFLIFEDIQPSLLQLGFKIQPLSGRTIVIEAIPADAKVGNEGKILLDILDFYRDGNISKYQGGEKLAAAYAVKNAIRPGEKLSTEAMNALVDQLFTTKDPYFCPQGLPALATLDLPEIERKLKRK